MNYWSTEKKALSLGHKTIKNMITTNELIKHLRNAFGDDMELPIAFWRSDEPVKVSEKIGGCFFKGLRAVRGGEPLSLCIENTGCGGGKFYLGFTDMPEYVPTFVSLKERYKQSPDDVMAFVESVNVERNCYRHFNFQRIDKMDSLDSIEGLLFFARPDVLSGLCGWAFFDNNEHDAVLTLFGSGCSALISNAVAENMRGGNSCFLGLFDPSVRPYVGADELGFSIPASRLVKMTDTLNECFLGGSHAWKIVKERINQDS